MLAPGAASATPSIPSAAADGSVKYRRQARSSWIPLTLWASGYLASNIIKTKVSGALCFLHFLYYQEHYGGDADDDKNKNETQLYYASHKHVSEKTGPTC